jgi:hypothetical protein
MNSRNKWHLDHRQAGSSSNKPVQQHEQYSRVSLPAWRPHLRALRPIILRKMDALDDGLGGPHARTSSSLSITQRSSDGPRHLRQQREEEAMVQGDDDAV